MCSFASVYKPGLISLCVNTNQIWHLPLQMNVHSHDLRRIKAVWPCLYQHGTAILESKQKSILPGTTSKRNFPGLSSLQGCSSTLFPGRKIVPCEHKCPKYQHHQMANIIISEHPRCVCNPVFSDMHLTHLYSQLIKNPHNSIIYIQHLTNICWAPHRYKTLCEVLSTFFFFVK